MNFKSFLAIGTQLQESTIFGDPRPVVLGYGAFAPFHIGYLPMISEMMKLGEQHDAELLLTIVRTPETSDEVLTTTVETLKRDYGFIKVAIERDVAQSIVKLTQFDRTPIAILGDSVMVDKALATCKMVQGSNMVAKHVPGYLEQMQQVCNRAINEGDLTTYRSYVLFTDEDTVTNTFNQLREANGQQ